ncbi:MAG: sugar phosphate isomerase/epimerase family protein [Candidatus Njordarchaeum guaymaensis]
MRFLFHLYKMDPIESSRLALKLNLGVELSFVTHDFLNYKKDKLELLKKVLTSIKVKSVHGPFRDLQPGSEDPFIRAVTAERYLQAIEISKILQVDWTLFHLNYFWNGHEALRKKWLDRAINIFLLLKDYDLEIRVENSHEKDPRIFKEFLKIINSEFTVNFCLDPSHVLAYSDKEIDEWINTLAPYIREVHLSETRKGFDLHFPLGSGLFDTRKFLEKIEETLGSEIDITIEPRSIDELKISLRWLEKNNYL